MTSMDLHVVEYEPEAALFVPDEDPLLFYKATAGFAASHLNPGGQVFVEIHDRQGEETADVFRKWFTNVELRKDIHGKDRMIRAHHG
jgi:release factor glutamine methyltransferase